MVERERKKRVFPVEMVLTKLFRIVLGSEFELSLFIYVYILQFILPQFASEIMDINAMNLPDLCFLEAHGP